MRPPLTSAKLLAINVDPSAASGTSRKLPHVRSPWTSAKPLAIHADLSAASGNFGTSTGAVPVDIGKASDNTCRPQRRKRHISELPQVRLPVTSAKLLAINVDRSAASGNFRTSTGTVTVDIGKALATNVDLSAASGHFRTSTSAVTLDIGKASSDKGRPQCREWQFQNFHRCGHQ